MAREIDVYRCRVGNFEKVAYARSLTEFCKLTGGEREYSSKTGTPAARALAEQAGEDHYMQQGRNGWERKPGFPLLAQRALAQAQAMAAGGGNTPAIQIAAGSAVKGTFSSTIPRYVVIAGERRGVYQRNGARWTLHDLTGRRVLCQRQWHVREGTLELAAWLKEPRQITIEPWDEAEALANAVEAWQADQLPSADEQARRKLARDTQHADQAAREQAMDRLLPEHAVLVAVLRRAASSDPEAARLLTIVTQPPVLDSDD